MTTATAPNSYLATAFYSQYNLILLGGSALFSLASASPLPLALGLGAETLWLGLGSRLASFRRHVDAQSDAERRGRLDDEVMSGMRRLDPEHTSRLLAVGQAISAISSRALAAGTGPGTITALAELEQLRPLFLGFCQLHERLSLRLQEMVQAPPQHEVARLAQAYAAEKDLGLRFSLHQSIKQAQRKVEQQARMVDLRRALELKLTLVEQALSHLYSQQQLGLPSQDFARDVEGLVAQVGSAASLEAELNDLTAVSVAPPSVAPAR